jgi:endonuclease-3
MQLKEMVIMKKSAKIDFMLNSFNSLYPDAKLELEYSNAFELLIAIILSAQCSDAKVNQVTRELYKKYTGPQDYLEVSSEELETDIRSTGFYRQKTRLIQGCCEKLLAEFEGEVPRDMEAMITLPGVGRKTAAMALGNAFDIQQGIAVDTHVKRVMHRLKLSTKSDVNKIEQELMKMVPQTDWTFFSNATILFGRQICQARKPRCAECPFEEWCPSPDKTTR